MRRRASSTPRWIASSSGFGGRISFVSHTTAGTPKATAKIAPIIKAVDMGASLVAVSDGTVYHDFQATIAARTKPGHYRRVSTAPAILSCSPCFRAEKATAMQEMKAIRPTTVLKPLPATAATVGR